jgi:hypothetical protein
VATHRRTSTTDRADRNTETVAIPKSDYTSHPDEQEDCADSRCVPGPASGHKGWLDARFRTSVLIVSTPSGALVMADSVRWSPPSVLWPRGTNAAVCRCSCISFTDFGDAIARVPGKRSSRTLKPKK